MTDMPRITAAISVVIEGVEELQRACRSMTRTFEEFSIEIERTLKTIRDRTMGKKLPYIPFDPSRTDGQMHTVSETNLRALQKAFMIGTPESKHNMYHPGSFPGDLSCNRTGFQLRPAGTPLPSNNVSPDWMPNWDQDDWHRAFPSLREPEPEASLCGFVHDEATLIVEHGNLAGLTDEMVKKLIGKMPDQFIFPLACGGDGLVMRAGACSWEVIPVATVEEPPQEYDIRMIGGDQTTLAIFKEDMWREVQGMAFWSTTKVKCYLGGGHEAVMPKHDILEAGGEIMDDPPKRLSSKEESAIRDKDPLDRPDGTLVELQGSRFVILEKGIYALESDIVSVAYMDARLLKLKDGAKLRNRFKFIYLRHGKIWRVSEGLLANYVMWDDVTADD